MWPSGPAAGRLGRGLAVVALSLAYVAYVFRRADGTFFTVGLGDWMDPYFINALLENWYRSLTHFAVPAYPQCPCCTSTEARNSYTPGVWCRHRLPVDGLDDISGSQDTRGRPHRIDPRHHNANGGAGRSGQIRCKDLDAHS